MSINIFTASGNIGQDYELKYTPNGKAIGEFSLPVKSGWGDNEKTSWVRCKIFGERAEKVAPYLTKGSKVTVSGAFKLDEWEKDGVKRSMPCILVNDFDLPPRSQSQQSNSQPQRSANPSQQHGANGFNDFDDEIAF